MWVRPAQINGPVINPENSGLISAQNGWPDIGPEYFLIFRAGLAQPKHLGWASTGPTQRQC